MLEICFRLGVKCVSAYAFSIENFKRSPLEVEAIMELARKGIEEICKEGYVETLSRVVRHHTRLIHSTFLRLLWICLRFHSGATGVANF